MSSRPEVWASGVCIFTIPEVCPSVLTKPFNNSSSCLPLHFMHLTHAQHVHTKHRTTAVEIIANMTFGGSPFHFLCSALTKPCVSPYMDLVGFAVGEGVYTSTVGGFPVAPPPWTGFRSVGAVLVSTVGGALGFTVGPFVGSFVASIGDALGTPVGALVSCVGCCGLGVS